MPPADPLIAHLQTVTTLSEQCARNAREIRVQSHDHLRIKPCPSSYQRMSATAVPEFTLLRKKSSDIARPSFSPIRGFQPSWVRAFVMSGQRRAGSSSGKAWKQIGRAHV